MNLFVCFFLWWLLPITFASEQIAVCINGQVARWQVEHIFHNLFYQNPEFSFTLFYNLQNSISGQQYAIYNTDKDILFQTSYMSHLTPSQRIELLYNYINKTSNIKLASISYHKYITRAQWSEILEEENLDRIKQYIEVQDTILNMYSHHVHCAKQIVLYEENKQISFDYIISTREDIYFFKPLYLESLIRYFKPNNTSYRCDMMSKECLNFWGINMRFHIYPKHVGIGILINRIKFYKFLFSRPYGLSYTHILNPEQFELAQAQLLQLQLCPISIEYLPVTAARYISPGKFCFIFMEVNKCIPKGFEKFVENHYCLEHQRNEILTQLYQGKTQFYMNGQKETFQFSSELTIGADQSIFQCKHVNLIDNILAISTIPSFNFYNSKNLNYSSFQKRLKYHFLSYRWNQNLNHWMNEDFDISRGKIL